MIGAAGWPREDLEQVKRCPVCASTDRVRAWSNLTDRNFRSAPGEWSFHICRGCGHWFLHPRPTPGSIGRAYRRYYTHEPAPETTRRDGTSLRERVRLGYLSRALGYPPEASSRLGGLLLPLISPRRALWIRRAVMHLQHPGTSCPRVLDVGSGSGHMVSYLGELGWRAEGLEPDAEAAAAARRRGLAVHEGAAEQMTDLFDPQSFDAIVLDHSLEHLHEPIEALHRCRRLLRPGGQIAIATPNVESVLHRAFSADWVSLDPPRHLSLFSAHSLSEALRRAGFQRPARLRPPSTIPTAYRQSLALSLDAEPFPTPREISISRRTHLIALELQASIRPTRAEELNLVARA